MRCDPDLTPEQERPPLDLPEGTPPLNSYYVYLTAGCNLACKHCWLAPAFQRNGGTGGHLDYDLFASNGGYGHTGRVRGIEETFLLHSALEI